MKPPLKKLWLLVGVTMLAIAALWAWWLYPQSTRQLGRENSGQYESFKNKVTNALAIFKKSKADKTSSLNDDVQALRERVFGDSTDKKP